MGYTDNLGCGVFPCVSRGGGGGVRVGISCTFCFPMEFSLCYHFDTSRA